MKYKRLPLDEVMSIYHKVPRAKSSEQGEEWGFFQPMPEDCIPEQKDFLLKFLQEYEE